MTFSEFAFSEAAFSEVAGAGVPSPYQDVWSVNYGVVFLYEMTVFNRAVTGAWIIPFSTYCFSEIPSEAYVSGLASLTFSDVGFTTAPTESPANTLYEGAVNDGLRITRTTPATPEAGRRVNLDLGGFRLSNNDGALDSALASYSVDGRPIRVLMGLETYPYSKFVPVFTGAMVEWSGMNSVNVTVRDLTYQLEIPIQATLYDGSGGANGGADLAGKPVPLTFGQKQNISPPLVDSTNLVFQFHSRQAQSVDVVYDRGAALIKDADYASYALLCAASITTGHFATCLAQGMFRLGSTPSGLVTADVKGDAQGTNSYVDTTAGIAQKILQDFGAWPAIGVDLATFTAFPITGTIGHYIDAAALITDVLDTIMAGAAGWWGPAYDGTIQLGFLQVPTADLYTIAIDESDVLGFDIVDPISGTFPPRYRQRVDYQTLGTAQQDTDLAGSVTAARRSFLAQASRTTYSQDLTVQNSYLLATDPNSLPSLLQNKADADDLASRLLTLYKSFRQTVRITVGLKGITGRLSSTALVTFPRLNGGATSPMLILDVVLDTGKRQVELTLWG